MNWLKDWCTIKRCVFFTFAYKYISKDVHIFLEKQQMYEILWKHCVLTINWGLHFQTIERSWPIICLNAQVQLFQYNAQI